MLIKLILFMFSAPALTYGVLTSPLLKSTRERITKIGQTNKIWKYIDEIANCSLCLGFWVGLLLWVLIVKIGILWIGFALTGSAISLLFYKIVTKL